MRVLICQLCNEEVPQNELFDHLVQKHNWQLKTETKIEKNIVQPQSVDKSKPKKKKNKGLWQKSPELLTCPHCSKKFKRKECLIEHMTKCSKRKIEIASEKVEGNSDSNDFSYNWACNQKLDKKYNKLLSKLVSEKDAEYLSKEVDSLVSVLNSEPNNQLAKNRLILVSKAKQRVQDKQGKTSSKFKKGKRPNALNFDRSLRRLKGVSQCSFCNKKRLECYSGFKNNGEAVNICRDCKSKQMKSKPQKKGDNKVVKTDAMDYRVAGSWGSGKSR